MRRLCATLVDDVRAKARWCHEDDGWRACGRTLVSDGTAAMVLYRLMQACRQGRLPLLEMVFNKLNAVLCNCIIGRGAEFGPEFVLIHASGVVINGTVRGGRGVLLEHQVTLGAERRRSPVLGSDIFVGVGAKIIGDVRIGDGARVGANAVVVEDVPARATVVGVPARVVRVREESRAR